MYQRNAQPNDLRKIVSWFSNNADGFIRWTGLDFDVEHAVESLEQLIEDTSVTQLAVFNTFDKLIGYYELHQRENEVYLARFAVHPDMRYKGIGRQILQHIIANAEMPVALIVYKTNLPALVLYNSLGFIPLDVEDKETLTLINYSVPAETL